MKLPAMNETLSDKKLPPGEGRVDFTFPDGTLPMLLDQFRRHGDIYKLKSVQRDDWTYVVSHPDLVRHVLGTNYRNYKKGVGIDVVNILLGCGLMVSEGDLWKRQRKMIQPMFHHSVLKAFTALMTRCSRKVIAAWQAKVRAGEVIDITEEMSQVTLNFILYALFSEDLDRLIEREGYNPFAIVTDESARNLQFARQFRALAGDVKEMVAVRQSKGRRPFDLLSMMMDARDKQTGEPMPEKQLVDEVLTAVVAGHETTASALNWIWYMISQHPEVEERLQHETAEVLGGREPTAADLKQLSFTRQVIEESMRLYPPGWLLTRRALAEDEIGGYHVPPGTDLFISPYIVHRHPQFWHDPEQFRPERFAPEQVAARPQGAYLAFSMGPRNCIGEAMAMQEMIIHISMVSQHLRLTFIPDQPVEIEAKVNLRPKHNLYMKPEALHP
jgi:enediyne biosynthesis protein E7